MKKIYHCSLVLLLLFHLAGKAQITTIAPSSCGNTGCNGKIGVTNFLQDFGISCPAYGSDPDADFQALIYGPNSFFDSHNLESTTGVVGFTLNGMCVGTYTLRIVDGSGGFGVCPADVEKVVVLNSFSAGPDIKLCGNQSQQAHLQGSICGPNSGFSWAPAQGLSSATTLSPSVYEPGSYTLSVVSNGVTRTDVVNVLPAISAFSYTTTGNSLLLHMDDAACSNLGFVWDFGNGTNNASAQNPVTTYANSGLYTVCLKCVGSTNCVSCVNLTFPSNTSGSVPVGLVDNGGLELSFTISPNPLADKASVKSSYYNGQTILQIHAVSGQVVKELSIGTSETTFDARDFSGGIYFYTLKENGRTLKKGKLIVAGE